MCAPNLSALLIHSPNYRCIWTISILFFVINIDLQFFWRVCEAEKNLISTGITNDYIVQDSVIRAAAPAGSYLVSSRLMRRWIMGHIYLLLLLRIAQSQHSRGSAIVNAAPRCVARNVQNMMFFRVQRSYIVLLEFLIRIDFLLLQFNMYLFREFDVLIRLLN